MIVLVAGLPGSGKSFFAERLASKLKASYINSDQVRHEMQATGSYSFSDKLGVYREMLKKVEEIIAANKDVVVDATFFHHTMREMFIDLARQQDVRLHVIEVVADEALIRERLKKPRRFSEADFGVYEVVRDSFEEITMPHLVLESKDDNLEKMLQAGVEYVRVVDV